MPCTNLICSGGRTTPDIISGFHSLELDRSSKKITEHGDDLLLGMDTSNEEISLLDHKHIQSKTMNMNQNTSIILQSKIG